MSEEVIYCGTMYICGLILAIAFLVKASRTDIPLILQKFIAGVVVVGSPLLIPFLCVVATVAAVAYMLGVVLFFVVKRTREYINE